MMKPTRDGFGEGLLELGKTNPKVVALSGDLADSTRAIWFQKAYPDRYIEIGIAEQNLIGTAAGLALAGKIPFACSFSAFITGRSWEQIRVAICYQNLNVKIAGSHGGLSVGADGATAEALEEFTIMRSLPNLTVLVPCDVVEARKATLAAAEHVGPVFIRLGRAPVPVVTAAEEPFVIGQASRRRDGKDLTIIACGIMVAAADAAAAQLAGEGTQARVLNMATIKPIDRTAVIAAAQETGAIVTVEEHTVVGGLGGAVAEVVVQDQPVPMRFVGTQDTFGVSGDPAELLKAFHLTADDIVQAAHEVLKIKQSAASNQQSATRRRPR
ncbi:MAG: transketolase family protein [Candidatus Omnitrophica bacterium]|nr:transketolase family protein [Candidatus Omnitrophota bacterium]